MGKNRYKVTLSFDTEKRKDFLTGFCKRKEARRVQAQAEIDKQLKEERIRIRKNKRDEMNARLEQITNIKLAHDIETTTCVDLDVNTIELPHHNVTVVESELFDPVTNMYMGSNEDVEEDDNEDLKVENTENEKTKTFNLKRSTAIVNKLAKTKQRLTTSNNSRRRAIKLQGPQNKATKKFFRKKNKDKKRRKK